MHSNVFSRTPMMSHAAGCNAAPISLMKTTIKYRPRLVAALDSGDLFGLRISADRLHQAIAVMLKDWRDGDFKLPRLAEIHMAAIEEKYREVGKALRAANEPRMTLPTTAPTHSEIAWYVRELTEAKAREEGMLAALRLVAKHADFSQCPDGVEEAVDAALLPPNTLAEPHP